MLGAARQSSAKEDRLSDQPVATAPAGRRWAVLLVAAALAALAVVLFAATAFSNTGGSQGSTGGTSGYQQVQQTPSQDSRARDCPEKSGRSNQPATPSDQAALQT
jgi:cytochrome c-type biogenesis protein CcmH/NrfG